MTQNPPPGWFTFGTHSDTDGPDLEFSSELDETGLPLWERETPLDLSTITTQTRQVTEVGIKLPYVRRDYRTKQFVDRGTVFITIETLEELAEQDMYDWCGTRCAIDLGHLEGLALEQAGLVARATRGGYHRTEMLSPFLANLQH